MRKWLEEFSVWFWKDGFFWMVTILIFLTLFTAFLQIWKKMDDLDVMKKREKEKKEKEKENGTKNS